MFRKILLLLFVTLSLFANSDILLKEKELSQKEIFFSIAKSIENKDQCYRLCLGGQGIVTLDNSITELTHLQDLNISQNEITFLPENFGNLNKLTELNLSGNKFARLPNSMSNLVNLKHLDLSSIELPDWENIFFVVRKLNSLEELDLSYNKIPFHLFDKLPENLKKMYLFDCGLNNEQIEIIRKRYYKIEIVI